MDDEILTKIYYKPENMATGSKAIQLLKKQSGIILKRSKIFFS